MVLQVSYSFFPGFFDQQNIKKNYCLLNSFAFITLKFHIEHKYHNLCLHMGITFRVFHSTEVYSCLKPVLIQVYG